MTHRLRAAVSAATLCVALGLGGCGSIKLPGRTSADAVTTAQLLRQAEDTREALIDEHGLYASPPLQAYVNEIGGRIAAVSRLPQLPWSFTILDTDAPNAFSLPGGQVFVTRGLLAYLQNEAELAAVLGHEVAHVTAQHGAQRAKDAAKAAAGVGAAVRVGEFLERQGLKGASERIRSFGMSLAGGLIANHSREQEFEADRIGTDYLARAGYDAREMVGVLQTLNRVERFEAAQPRSPGREAARPDWLATHPATEQRLREAERYATTARPVAADGRQRYLERIEGLVFGDSAERGLVRERLFVHPRAGYAITAPPGWAIEAEGSAATLRPPEGDAMLTVRLLPRSAGRTPQEGIQKVLAPTEGRGSARSVGGFAGMHFVGSRLQGEQRRPLRSTLVVGPGDRLFLIDYTSRSGEFDAELLKTMQAAEQSFRAITAADRRAAREWRVQRVPMPEGGFAALAKASPLPGDTAEATLRLLNGHYGLPPGGSAEAEPAVGAMVKTVR